MIALDPMQRGRALWFPLRLRELTVSVEDPVRLLAELRRTGTNGGVRAGR